MYHWKKDWTQILENFIDLLTATHLKVIVLIKTPLIKAQTDKEIRIGIAKAFQALSIDWVGQYDEEESAKALFRCSQ